jgi:hypothetical protein
MVYRTASFDIRPNALFLTSGKEGIFSGHSSARSTLPIPVRGRNAGVSALLASILRLQLLLSVQASLFLNTRFVQSRFFAFGMICGDLG